MSSPEAQRREQSALLRRMAHWGASEGPKGLLRWGPRPIGAAFGLALLVAASVAVDIPLSDARPRNDRDFFGPLFDAIHQGFLDFYDTTLPFDRLEFAFMHSLILLALFLRAFVIEAIVFEERLEAVVVGRVHRDAALARLALERREIQRPGPDQRLLHEDVLAGAHELREHARLGGVGHAEHHGVVVGARNLLDRRVGRAGRDGIDRRDDAVAGEPHALVALDAEAGDHQPHAHA